MLAPSARTVPRAMAIAERWALKRFMATSSMRTGGSCPGATTRPRHLTTSEHASPHLTGVSPERRRARREPGLMSESEIGDLGANMNDAVPASNPAARVLFASLVGTTIEFFDFYSYATAAVLVFPHLFFPGSDPTTAVLQSFAT